jgi:hypothetical protein
LPCVEICFLDLPFSLVPQWILILKKMKVMHIKSTSTRIYYVFHGDNILDDPCDFLDEEVEEMNNPVIKENGTVF